MSVGELDSSGEDEVMHMLSKKFMLGQSVVEVVCGEPSFVYQVSR